jgi:hypothetical protein
MGAIAAAGSVTVMIPMDTVKTRLVIQVMVVREGGMDGWTDGWIDRRMDRWMDGWIDGWKGFCRFCFEYR